MTVVVRNSTCWARRTLILRCCHVGNSASLCMCQMKGVELTEREPFPFVQCFGAVELGYSMFARWAGHLSWRCLFHSVASDPGGKQSILSSPRPGVPDRRKEHVKAKRKRG